VVPQQKLKKLQTAKSQTETEREKPIKKTNKNNQQQSSYKQQKW